MSSMTIDECREAVRYSRAAELCYGGDVVPANTDAAMEIIEKSGWTMASLEVVTGSAPSCCVRAIATTPKHPYEAIANVDWYMKRPFDPPPTSAYQTALWNLAAAVTRQEGKQ